MRVIALIVRAGAVVVAPGFLFSLVIDGADTPVVAPRGRRPWLRDDACRRSRPQRLPGRRSRPAW